MATREHVLILAAHGSSHPGAKSALEAFAARVGTAHPNTRVVLAYTAFSKSGAHAPHRVGSSLETVLEGLGSAPADLTVLSLHVIAGGEFDRMVRTLRAYAARTGSALDMAGPLLESPADAPGVARALAGSMGSPPDGEAVVLMGHGTTHDAQELYRVLAGELALTLPGARLGVLEAADPEDPLSIQAIARGLAADGVRSARLAPFLTVAGRHAHKDLAGDQPGSWKSVLAGYGIACRPDLAGLVEREAFSALWLGRAAALARG